MRAFQMKIKIAFDLLISITTIITLIMQATDARRIGGNPILLSVLKSREEF